MNLMTRRKPFVLGRRPLFATWVAVMIVGLVMLGTVGEANAQSAQYEKRLQRLERLLGSKSLLQMFQTVESLKQEVRTLRGKLEVQGNELKKLRREQKSQYQDVDKRLQEVAEAQASRVAQSADRPSTDQGPGQENAAAGAAENEPGPTRGSASSAGGSDRMAAVSPGTQTGSDGASGLADSDALSEQRAYKEAFSLLKAGKYDDAIGAFNGFLANYGQGEFADNAQFWLGETYYVTQRYEPALSEFQKLLARYPNSKKRTHAMLKIGYVHDELGHTNEAREALTKLTEQYPNTTAAGLARKRLQRLRNR